MGIMKVAVAYLRVSTDKQDEEYQLEYINKFIEDNKWERGDTYRDHGSAYNENKVRPDFERMLEDAKKGKFGHIVVYDLDRFSRRKAEEVLDLIKQLRIIYGVEVNAVFGDEWKDLINVINHIPEMGFIGKSLCDFLESIIVGIKAHNAHIYSEKLSDCVRNSPRFQKAKEERRVGRPSIKTDTKELIQLREQGLSYGEIAKKLNLTKSFVYKTLNNSY